MAHPWKTLWQFLNKRVQWPNQFLEWLKSIDGLMLAIATGVLAWIAFWQWAALDHTDTTLRNTLIASNRAWIGQLGMDTIGKVNDKNDLIVKVYYSNTGKSPAFNMNTSFLSGTVPIPGGSNVSRPTAVGPNRTCEGLMPNRDGAAAFPDLGSHWMESVIRRQDIDPSVLVNKGALYVQGCFVYETMNEIHRTWFCNIAYIDEAYSAQSQTLDCKDGRGAD